MNILKYAYLLSTFLVASFFLVLFWYSDSLFCLLPVFLVLGDYYRLAYRCNYTTPYEAAISSDDPRSPYYVAPMFREAQRRNEAYKAKKDVNLFVEFFTKEEFKV